MKYLHTVFLTLGFVLMGFAQKGFYVSYTTTIEASGAQAEMMLNMMNGSTMEIASNAQRTWVKNKVGSMMTTEMELHVESKEMTMYMSGMVGNMAFRGNSDDLEDAKSEEKTEPKVELLNDTKTVLGVLCKKAIAKDMEGNTTTLWYTEDFDRPEGMVQMPNAVPGLCLEFEIVTDDIKITYTAIAFDDNANLADYNLSIPEDVEIQSFEYMLNMDSNKN